MHGDGEIRICVGSTIQVDEIPFYKSIITLLTMLIDSAEKREAELQKMIGLRKTRKPRAKKTELAAPLEEADSD